LTALLNNDFRVTLLWTLAAFLAFMAIVWSVHALDDYAMARYGYAPFAMSNLLFMSIPSGLLLLVVREGGAGMQTRVLVTLVGAAMLGIFLLVKARTNGWIALFVAPMLLVFSPVLVFSVLFRSLARADGNGEE
jgi:hypothetical protein